MKHYIFGKTESPVILIQPVDNQELDLIENEVSAIRDLTGKDFCLVAVKTDSWNNDLSPWCAPPVFGKEGFGDGAANTLSYITSICNDPSKKYILGGYSLAGLFSLWASYQSDTFCGIAAASPSVWFPGFTDYISKNTPRCNAVYLSLGDREEKTKNPVMKTVGDCIKNTYDTLTSQKIICTLEWNEGNHFKDADIRSAKGFAWILGTLP